MMSRHPFGLLLYYRLFSTAFNTEMQEVGTGRRLYSAAGAGSQNEFLLRRNIHRIEKGLSMRPRRATFALEYIEETAKSYATVAHSIQSGADRDLRGARWAQDVLSEYFRVVDSAPAAVRARDVFLSSPPVVVPQDDVVERVGRPEALAAPYARRIPDQSPVEYVDLLALARQRRSVRWFQDRSVPRELVDQAIEVAALSPSACNRQPFTFRIFDDPEMVRQVSVQPGGARGFADNVPMMVVVVGSLRAYFSERDRHVIYIDGSLASMSFLFACESLGLATCCINWPDIHTQNARLSKLIGLEPDQRAVMFIAVGYPDPSALVPYSGKKSIDNLRRYN